MVHEKGVLLTTKGQQEGEVSGDGIILCVACGGGYTNPYM